MDANEKKTWLKVFIVIIIVAVGLLLFFNFFGSGIMDDEMMGDGMMGGMMGFGWLFMLLPVILVVVLIYALLGRESHDKSSDYESENPLHILKQRYARGNISREDYLRIKKDLYG